MSIFDDSLVGKSQSEKVSLKVAEITKYDHKGTFVPGKVDLTVEIVDLHSIEGGVEVLARATKKGKKVGFGKDGSSETERFRIFNPPVLVADLNGDIVRDATVDGVHIVGKYRLDPVEAIRSSLVHTISIVGKDDKNIVPGKVGNTTDTFYPAAGANEPADGYVENYTGVSGVSWATLIAGTGDSVDVSSATYYYIYIHPTANTPEFNTHAFSIFMFNTASIPDTDTITSATLSLFGRSDLHFTEAGTDLTSNIYAATTASTSTISNSDYQNTLANTTAFSTGVAQASWSQSAYNDFALNASGLANISKTGISKFAVVNEDAMTGSVPSLTVSGNSRCTTCGYLADATGTTNDPKLVVVHEAVATSTNLPLLGVGT